MRKSSNWRQLIAGACALAALGAGAEAAATPEGGGFARWLKAFRVEALAEGVSPQTFDAAFAGVQVVDRVTEANDSQPEFSRPFWAYLDGAAGPARVERGLTRQSEQTALLRSIAQSYGVDASVIAAIWGLESNYGAILGDYDVIAALATLAYDSRRTDYGRAQLLGALQILDRGYANKAQLKGSWAGAMGQTQFIPTTYLSYAVDHDGDGRRDVWSNYGDVFASTANYLSKSGWTLGRPWGFEVTLPDGFAYAEADLSEKRSTAYWARSGVRRPDGETLTRDASLLNSQSSIIVPTGAGGPAFIVFDNFRAILRYNNSTAYALGVGMLADALSGDPFELVRDWPRGETPLSRTERVALQEALARRGFNPGDADGILGARTRAAIRAFQKTQGMPQDGYATHEILRRLTAS